MKQVNPRFVNITREYRYVKINNICLDFKDEFTNGDYRKTGCFGCEHLRASWSSLSCNKNHLVKIAYIRKNDDNTIADGCITYMSKHRKSAGYRSSFCNGCRNYYRGGGMGKCKLKYSIKKEVFKL